MQHIEKVQKFSNDGDTATTRTSEYIDNQEVQSTPVRRRNGAFTLARLIWFVTGVILVLLAFRFVLVLLGANPANGFANFIYTVSHPFAAPFFGLFSYNLKYGVSRFEVSTLVAMAVYALVGYGLARLVTINQPEA